MTRKLLTGAVEAAAQRCGIGFCTGPEHRIIQDIGHFPTVWLLPPRMVGCEGIHEGIKTYAVDIRLMDKNPGLPTSDTEEHWQRMEETAFEICRIVAECEWVKSIAQVTFDVGEDALSIRGEHFITIKMRVEMPFGATKSENLCK